MRHESATRIELLGDRAQPRLTRSPRRGERSDSQVLNEGGDVGTTRPEAARASAGIDDPYPEDATAAK
jgi:hypothetical protein